MKRKAILALTLAGLVALQTPMTALADPTHKHGDTVVTSDDQENQDVTFTGRVIAVKVEGNETCNVKNITTGGAAAISAQEGAKVTADSAKNSSQGSATVLAKNATVTVDGAVTNEGIGRAIQASNGATVTAGSATNTSESSVTVVATGKNGETEPAKQTKVTVTGAVTNNGPGIAIEATKGATVTAGSATNNGTYTTVSATGANTVVTVKATEGVEGATGVVTNNGTGKAIEAGNGATVTAGSATSNGDVPTVNADNATVKVDAAVTNNGVGKAIQVINGATVTADSVTSNNTGIQIGNNSLENYGTVIVSGDVTSKNGYAIEAYGSSTKDTKVTVDGKVVAGSTAVQATNSKTVVEIAGSVTGTTGICAVSGATVKAQSVTSTGSDESNGGILAQESGSVIVIEEDVKAENIGVAAANGGIIVVEGTVEGKNTAALIDDSSKIIVYELKTGEGGKLIDGTEDNVYYLIKQVAGNRISGDITGTTKEEIAGTNYEYAKKGVTLTMKVDDGYELKAGEIKVTLNADGTYSVTVPEGGGVTLDTVLKAVEQAQAEAEEKKATVTGSEGIAVIGGQWNVGPGGYWTYRNNGIFKDTWGYITLANGQTGWFYFDKNGVMATGWKKINDKWYYFNEVNDGTQGMMLTNTTTPDGYKVGADGAMIQ